ncbi:fructose-1,6-bisphosphatase [Pseudoclavibacter endophyticus]|uniref:Fructose-1,6-bisphosphatase n=1 Tax=Pseudoclavibacter endophyticus TaxID=1778590 RepID=A0A6H9WLI0_9MICO|nr:class II fructose-bisphosphatase [Pseudoclavibacter endophyticus]KAB1649696.1 class II fructose-bisphosphatase [Pseudoclavibacter endophyticus]GGA60499.1 fructose-1,6-bisphosphatase [Pseudoclavibacter endophyticus]
MTDSQAAGRDSRTPDPMQADRNLAMELVRATEAAAIRAVPWIGRGNKNGADKAAVDAMRKFLSTVEFQGRVVIGEGEKDEAPMLYNGEIVGNGEGPECDIAVDPIDGTSLTAAGRHNALSVIAVADRGTMYDPKDLYYMEKLATGPEGVGVVDLARPIGENVKALAKAKGKPVEDMVVAILDRPRHEQLIHDVREAGAGTELLLDGDVAGGINAARPDSRIDMCVGIGGTPEGIITACALKALGGVLHGRMYPRNDEERERALAAGHDLDAVLTQDDLVKTDNTYFVATGVTDGGLCAGVRRFGDRIFTDSLVLRSRSGTVRRVEAEHLVAKWL